MKHSIKTGFSFGITSAVITTLGLMAGLYSGTKSQTAVLGAVIMVALADSLSDALGIHVAEEAENAHTHRTVWEATLSTFFFKSVVTLTFAIPILLFELKPAVWTAIIWGGLLLAVFSFHLGGARRIDRIKVMAEHLLIAVFVVAATYTIGIWISGRFGSI